MDKGKFFASLRQRNSGVFGTSLSQRQVESTDTLMDAATVPADFADDQHWP